MERRYLNRKEIEFIRYVIKNIDMKLSVDWVYNNHQFEEEVEVSRQQLLNFVNNDTAVLIAVFAMVHYKQISEIVTYSTTKQLRSIFFRIFGIERGEV